MREQNSRCHYLMGVLFHPPNPIYQPSALIDHLKKFVDILSRQLYRGVCHHWLVSSISYISNLFWVYIYTQIESQITQKNFIDNSCCFKMFAYPQGTHCCSGHQRHHERLHISKRHKEGHVWRTVTLYIACLPRLNCVNCILEASS